ncbi:MAG: VOC family protein [Christiangramia sp.]|uniref:VOC family protein n=1 Tax=Christiangramia sp. TaxID=1931228 RepID=UPI003242B005
MILIFLSAGCVDSHAKKNPDKSALLVDSVTTTAEQEPKVIGIGGIFFYADSLAATQEWYRKNLGIELNDWGSASFDSRKIEDPEEEQSLQWKPFAKGDAYFAPSQKDFMINYQVQNLEGLLERLRKNGVRILDSVETYDYGKFVHILDAEGNKIELWEPAEEPE